MQSLAFEPTKWEDGCVPHELQRSILLSLLGRVEELHVVGACSEAVFDVLEALGDRAPRAFFTLKG